MENYNRVKKNEWGTFYYLDDKYHRLEEPAIEWFDGSKSWYKNGLEHRLDGPAEEWINGDRFWYKNGNLHRIDGPAVEYINGYKAWYYEGKKIDCNSQEEFERYIKLKLFW